LIIKKREGKGREERKEGVEIYFFFLSFFSPSSSV